MSGMQDSVPLAVADQPGSPPPHKPKCRKLDTHEWVHVATLVAVCVALALSIWNATQTHSLRGDLATSQQTQEAASMNLTVQALQWVGELAFDQAVYGPTTANGTLDFGPTGMFDKLSGDRYSSYLATSYCDPVVRWTKQQNHLLLFLQTFTCPAHTAGFSSRYQPLEYQFSNVSWWLPQDSQSGLPQSFPGAAPGRWKCTGVAFVNGIASGVAIYPQLLVLDMPGVVFQFHDGQYSNDPLSVYFAVVCPTAW